jgi:hypothetical protein
MAASMSGQKLAGKRILVYVQSIAQNKITQAQFTEVCYFVVQSIGKLIKSLAFFP